MKLINPETKILLQDPTLEGVYKQIELCGRTCYKSEDKITEDSAKGFVDRMIKSNHTAMLEHGTVYLIIKWWHIIKFFKYLFNPYSKVHRYRYITTNLRVITEKKWDNDLKYICEPTKYHEKRYTMKFITDRGVSHELVRHRVFSFAQESTRYCNYSKDKFGNEISFIIPSWAHTLQEGVLGYSVLEITPKEASFMQSCYDSEKRYLEMVQQENATPQEARQVLPNSVKTEVCMTGFVSDWRYFFDLRLFGKTGAPHPDMLRLATLMEEEAIKVGIWDDIKV